MRLMLFGALLLSATIAAGCDSTKSAPRTPLHVDSVIPMDVALDRFRLGMVPEKVLKGGSATRDGLVRDFLARLEGRDTAGLARLALSREEFAFLYYETNPQARPPYELSPDLMWFTLSSAGRKGLSRALEAFGGQRLALLGYGCEGAASRQGGNQVWGPCRVEWLRAPGDTARARLFGLIIERGGVFKFVSLANRL